jgi:hypothetical protein
VACILKTPLLRSVFLFSPEHKQVRHRPKTKNPRKNAGDFEDVDT